MKCISCGHDHAYHYYVKTGPQFQKCELCDCERNLITGAWLEDV